MISKICPFLSDANIRHECTEKCALSCAEHDYDDDGRVVKTYTRCAFKELIYELMRITHPMDVQFAKYSEVK